MLTGPEVPGREFSRSRVGRRSPNDRFVDSVFARIDVNEDGELSLVEFADRFSVGGPRPGPPPGMGKSKSKGKGKGRGPGR